jgi:hypothetical protein
VAARYQRPEREREATRHGRGATRCDPRVRPAEEPPGRVRASGPGVPVLSDEFHSRFCGLPRLAHLFPACLAPACPVRVEFFTAAASCSVAPFRSRGHSVLSAESRCLVVPNAAAQSRAGYAPLATPNRRVPAAFDTRTAGTEPGRYKKAATLCCDVRPRLTMLLRSPDRCAGRVAKGTTVASAGVSRIGSVGIMPTAGRAG